MTITFAGVTAYNNFAKRAGRWDDEQCTYSIQVMCEASGKFIFQCPFNTCFTHIIKLRLLRASR